MLTLEVMSVTQSLRDRVVARIDGGETVYRIAKDAGVDWATLKRFIDGGGLRVEQVDKLCAYFNLVLCDGDVTDDDPPAKPSKRSPRK